MIAQILVAQLGASTRIKIVSIRALTQTLSTN